MVFEGVLEKMSATSREVWSVSEILPLFYFLFNLFRFHYFLLHDHFERVSAELVHYGSNRTDSESDYKDDPLQ